MFNKSKVRKVNDLLDVAENCLNNKDRENARKAMEESYNLIKKISGYDKTKLSVRWMEIAEKSDNLAEEIANAGLTEEQIAKKKADEKVRKDKNLKEYNENKKLIDDNPLYTKWADYFWEHRLENDEALQQKFVPLSIEDFKKMRYDDEHGEFDESKCPREFAKYLTEKLWINESLGCLKYGADKYLYFELLCKHALVREFSRFFTDFKLDRIYFDFIEKKSKIDVNKNIIIVTEDKNKNIEYSLKEYPCCISQEIINNSSYIGKFVAYLWQELCDTDITNPDLSKFKNRLDALGKVDEIGMEVFHNKLKVNNAYLFATKYFEFVEKNPRE